MCCSGVQTFSGPVAQFRAPVAQFRGYDAQWRQPSASGFGALPAYAIMPIALAPVAEKASGWLLPLAGAALAGAAVVMLRRKKLKGKS